MWVRAIALLAAHAAAALFSAGVYELEEALWPMPTTEDENLWEVLVAVLVTFGPISLPMSAIILAHAYSHGRETITNVVGIGILTVITALAAIILYVRLIFEEWIDDWTAVVLVGAAAGALGGWIYWCIAVRRSVSATEREQTARAEC